MMHVSGYIISGDPFWVYANQMAIVQKNLLSVYYWCMKEVVYVFQFSHIQRYLEIYQV